ncbi:hypothetical protein BX666DRAFT_2030367 [Dichotomocladium elegans]|nr:hypothetical protein BX666DRAFT_2030367 [Dichotomocladium elegans]
MTFSEAHWNTNRSQPKPRMVDKELQRLKTLKVVTKTFQETPPPTITPSPTASTVSRCYSPVPSETWHSRRSSVYTDDGSSSVALGPFRGRTLVEEPMPITPIPASATQTTTAMQSTATIQKQPSFHAYDLRKQRSFIVEEPLPIMSNRQPSLPAHDPNVRKQPSFHQDHIRKQSSFHSEMSLMSSRGHHKKHEEEEEGAKEDEEQEDEEQKLRDLKEQHHQKQQALLEARIAELEAQLAKTKIELELEREQHSKTRKELEGVCTTLRAKVSQLEDAAAQNPIPSPPSAQPGDPLGTVEESRHVLPAAKEQEEDQRSQMPSTAPSSSPSGNNDDAGILEFTHQLDARLSVSREIDHLRIWEPPKSVTDNASIHRRDSTSLKDGATFWRGMKKKLRV